MPKVVIANDKREVEVPEGAVLRDALINAGVQVNFEVIEIGSGLLGRYLNCRGLGLCGTCKVLVKKGMENLAPKGVSHDQWQAHQKQNGEAKNSAPPRTFPERFTLWRMLSAVGQEDEMRLACQVQVYGDCTIEINPQFNWSGDNFWQKPYPNK